jgi:hypothetical protein
MKPKRQKSERTHPKPAVKPRIGRDLKGVRPLAK